MDRRTFVLAAGGVIFSIAGCLQTSNRSSNNADSEQTGSATTKQRESVTAPTKPTTTPSHSETTVGNAPYVGKFVLWNDDNKPHLLSVSVTKEELTLLKTTRKLTPDSSIHIDNLITNQETYRIQAKTQSGVEKTFTWKISACNNYEYIQIHINESSDIEIRTMKQTIAPPPSCSNRTSSISHTSDTEATSAINTHNSPPLSDSTSQAPLFQGTVVTERDPADIFIENTTNNRQTITITVTLLPNNLIPRPRSKAPYEPRTLSGQSALFSETITLSSGGEKAYLGRVRPPGNYGITVEVRNGPTGAFDWHRGTEQVRIDINDSSIEFSSWA